jgi:hypothetical protein
VPPLLREVVFRRYWTASTISMVGDQVTTIAVPLTAVLALHAGAATMGYLTALEWLPSLLFGMHAGAWADRSGRRRQLMIACDLGRCALLASVPVCWALGVQPGMSFLLGPSLGGLLTAPLAIVTDAVSFLGSAFFLRRIDPMEPPADDGKGGVTQGLRFIAHSPVVRASLIGVAVVNFFNLMFFALLTLYAVRVLHVSAGLLGLVLGCGAIGGLLGSAVGLRPALWVAVIGGVVGAALLVPSPLPRFRLSD